MAELVWACLKRHMKMMRKVLVILVFGYGLTFNHDVDFFMPYCHVLVAYHQAAEEALATPCRVDE